MGDGLHEDEDVGDAEGGGDEHGPAAGVLAVLGGVAERLRHEEQGGLAGDGGAEHEQGEEEVGEHFEQALRVAVEAGAVAVPVGRRVQLPGFHAVGHLWLRRVCVGFLAWLGRELERNQLFQTLCF